MHTVLVGTVLTLCPLVGPLAVAQGGEPSSTRVIHSGEPHGVAMLAVLEFKSDVKTKALTAKEQRCPGSALMNGGISGHQIPPRVRREWSNSVPNLLETSQSPAISDSNRRLKSSAASLISWSRPGAPQIGQTLTILM